MLFAIYKSLELMLNGFKKDFKRDIFIMSLFLAYSFSVHMSIRDIAFNIFLYFIVIPLISSPIRYLVWKRTGKVL